MNIKRYLADTLPPLIFIIILVIIVGKMNFENGKIDMCRDLGGELAIDIYNEKHCIMGKELEDVLNPPAYNWQSNYIKNLLRNDNTTLGGK